MIVANVQHLCQKLLIAIFPTPGGHAKIVCLEIELSILVHRAYTEYYVPLNIAFLPSSPTLVSFLNGPLYSKSIWLQRIAKRVKAEVWVSEAHTTQSLTGWGRMVHGESTVYRPEKRSALHSIIEQHQASTLIARGLGRSYGDAPVNDGGTVVDMNRLDRMLHFDPASATLECECGTSLEDIINAFLPRGYFLPVTPGTKFVSVGGAIANDIHGKNHHRDGTFSNFVNQFTLLTPSGEILTCSREENDKLFWATIGGIGLTGILLTAHIRLQPVQSAYITVDYHRAKNLDNALATMTDSDDNYQYSVAWVDCLAKGASLGRSVLMRGNHTPVKDLPPHLTDAPFQNSPNRAKLLPFDFPEFILHPLSIKAFNTAFYAFHRERQGAIVHYDKYFYPLDGIHHWNRLYGKRGFAQYQATLPPQSLNGLITLLERLSTSLKASFLAVLKCFGEQGKGLLSHPMKGYTLTLDIAQHGDLVSFLRSLDEILLDHGGRLYLAKDVAAAPETIAAMYPNFDSFRDIKQQLDPENTFSSTMSRRLGITSD